jgi:hypothetical protein
MMVQSEQGILLQNTALTCGASNVILWSRLL